MLNLMKTIIITVALFCTIQTLFSPYYRRCRLNSSQVDGDAIPIQQLQTWIPAEYYPGSYIEPVIKTQLQLEYEQFQYYFIEFIDSGGSGQVYLVQDQMTKQGKVVKRYFKEKPLEFKRQNYILKTLNYQIKWIKDCGTEKCTDKTEDYHTVSVFPYKESIVLRKLQFDGEQAPIIFYKILKELDKTHKKGIIHNDIKMGNILINSVGPNFKFYDVQLIDWNLASFYFRGYDSSLKRGTVCYYSPEQLFRTNHITPVIDVWALAIVIFTYYTDEKPFLFNCKTDNMRAIVTLIGGAKILEMYKKYNFGNTEYLSLLNEIEKNPQKFPARNLSNYKPKHFKQSYTQQFVDVLNSMLEPDPEKRVTPQQLMKMPYFRKVKVLPDMYYYQRKKNNKITGAEQPTQKAIEQ